MTTMNWKTVVLRFAVLTLVFSLGLIASTNAQPLDKRTNFTFTHQVELPGNVTLPPGEYIFRLADETTGRRVVQILSAADREPQALLLSIPAQRPEPSDDPQVRFMEVAEGQPQAVHIWWYGGERTGYEFVYPKEQAMRLAQATGTSVAMTESPMTTTEEMRTAEVTRTEISDEPEPVAETRAAAEPEDEPEVDVAERDVAQAESTVARNQPTDRSRLPQTASPLALVGLLGALSLLGATGLRLFR